MRDDRPEIGFGSPAAREISRVIAQFGKPYRCAATPHNNGECPQTCQRREVDRGHRGTVDHYALNGRLDLLHEFGRRPPLRGRIRASIVIATLDVTQPRPSSAATSEPFAGL